jgi:predicted esterase
MSVAEIEAAITKLPPQDVEKLAVWLADYRNRAWDEQIAQDLDAGRLDAFLASAEAEYQAGKVRPL